MRIGVITLLFGAALLWPVLGGQLPGGRSVVTGVTPDRHIKCGFYDRPHLPLSKAAGLLGRPTMQAVYLSPDSAFAVHYDTTGKHAPDLTDIDGNGEPDWVVEVAVALDSVRNLLLTLGYKPAPDDGDGIYDVFLVDTVKYGSYGDTNFTPGEGPIISYMGMDNDFAENRYNTHGLDAALITVAHEYFHAVQLAYGWHSGNDFFYELSSTWFEDIAYPEVNDWVYYFNDFGDNPTQNMAQTDGYPIAIFGHYLTRTYGLDLMLQAWERFKLTGATTAISESIATYGSSLTSAWTDFVALLFFNGLEPAYYFYSDQDLLDAPSPGPVEVLSGDVQRTFTFLRPGKVDIQAFELAQPANLRLEIETAPPKHAGRIILDAPGWSLHNLTTQPWYASGLSSLARLVVVVGSSGENVIVSAAATDTLTGLVFELNVVGPNPLHPRWPNHRQLAIGYTVARAMTEGEHRVEIYNLLGQEVYRWQDWLAVGEGSHTLRLPTPAMASWPSGMYLLRFTLDRRYTFTRKFTILR